MPLGTPKEKIEQWSDANSSRCSAKSCSGIHFTPQQLSMLIRPKLSGSDRVTTRRSSRGCRSHPAARWERAQAGTIGRSVGASTNRLAAAVQDILAPYMWLSCLVCEHR